MRRVSGARPRVREFSRSAQRGRIAPSQFGFLERQALAVEILLQKIFVDPALHADGLNCSFAIFALRQTGGQDDVVGRRIRFALDGTARPVGAFAVFLKSETGEGLGPVHEAESEVARAQADRSADVVVTGFRLTERGLEDAHQGQGHGAIGIELMCLGQVR